MIRRPPRSTRKESSAASDVYKRQTMVMPVAIQSVFGAGFQRKKQRKLSGNISIEWLDPNRGRSNALSSGIKIDKNDVIAATPKAMAIAATSARRRHSVRGGAFADEKLGAAYGLVFSCVKNNLQSDNVCDHRKPASSESSSLRTTCNFPVEKSTGELLQV